MRRSVLLSAFTTAILLGIGFVGSAQQAGQSGAGAQAPQTQQPSGPQGTGPNGRTLNAAQPAPDTCWQHTPCYEDHRPSLAFREDWTDATPNIPADYKDRDLDAHLQNKFLTMVRYGTGAKDVIYDRHLAPKDDPGYIWLGSCAAGPCVITIKDKNDYLDMSNPLSKVVWRTKQGGFRQLRLVLKLVDGTFLVSDKFAGPSDDWNVSEIVMGDVHWRQLIIKDPRLYEDAWVPNPNLSKVDEIGFSDLMLGGPGFNSGTSRVDWIEVYANKVARPTPISSVGSTTSQAKQ
jgi:hypothetical protein